MAFAYTFLTEKDFEKHCPRAIQMRDYAETVSRAKSICFHKAIRDKNNENSFSAIYDYAGHTIQITCILSDSLDKPDEYSYTINPA